MLLNDHKPMRLACIFEPELDLSPKEAAEYVGTRDEALLKASPGEALTVFYARRVTHKQRAYITGSGGADEQRIRAFQCSVVRVDNFRERDTRMLLAPVWQPARMLAAKRSQLPLEILTDDELEAFDHAVVQEIGGAVLHLSFFPRWTGARCPLLPISEQTWMAAAVRLAAQAVSTEATGTSDALSPNSSTSDEPGAAIAME